VNRLWSGWISGAADRTIALAGSTGDVVSFLGETAAALADAVAHPRRVRWRETFYYMELCGRTALPIVALICLLMGMILGFQAALQLRQFGTDVFVADLVGFSVVKELGPLMVAIIATGRAGSAFAAEIGTMRVSEEVDALITMGLSPARFLVVPKVLAMVVVMPLLTLFGNLAGVLGGLLISRLYLGLPGAVYWDRTLTVLSPGDLAEGLSKSLVFAVLITLAGCLRGFEARNDAQSVGRSATSAVVTSIFLIIVADALMTLLFGVFLP
jgi:phospholipid/cholesterol/gamma-HCH transport system permease protein